MTLRQIDGGPDYYAQFTNSLPTDPNFFPIGVWFESILSQSDIDLDRAAGLNTYVVLTGNSNLSLLQPNGMYAIPQSSEWARNPEAMNNPNVVGWELFDEIDMQHGPGAGYTTLTSIINSLPNDGRMLYNNYGKGVIFWETDTEAARFINDFQDVTSADIYWFTDPNVHSPSEGGRFLTGQDIDLTEDQTDLAANYGYVVDRMRYLDGLDGERQPIWAFVEVGWPFTETAIQGGEAIAPEEIQAAVMHSLIAGAQGIIYFNHSFGGPDYTQHALRDPQYAAERAAVTEIDALIAQLAPVLNSPFDDGYATVSDGVRLMSKYYAAADDHYVFAASTQHAANTATFTLAGANPDMDGTIVVVDESRAITVIDGVWTDFFADGNAWHVYQVELGVAPPPVAGLVAIGDASISEGNDGVSLAIFTATRGGGTEAFDVTYFTSDGTATVADGDYTASSGTLHFAAGQDTATFTVAINGDTKIESNESYSVNLSNATNGAIVGDGSGAGVIVNDDISPPSTTINGTSGNDILTGTAGSDIINGRAGSDTIDGGAGDDMIHGNSGSDVIDGGSGADTIWGDAGSDQFVFRIGEADGDSVMNFDGRGARAGDSLLFVGYGTGSFTQIDASHWQISSADGLVHDIITIRASVHSSDYLFV